jgi:CRP/FNR family transcriptional regulator
MQQIEKYEDRVTALARVPLLANLSRESLDGLARGMLRRRLRAGAIVFLEGQSCDGLYIVESGLVKLYKTSRGGREQALTTHGPGESLSELPVVDGGRHPSCAAAVKRSTLLFISTQVVQSVCKTEPRCAQNVLGVVARRLRTAWDKIEELSFAGVQRRLATYLMRLASCGKIPSTTRFTQLPTNHEIASEIGTVRELVSRHLGRFNEQGIIRLAGRKFCVLDVDALAREAAGIHRSHVSHRPLAIVQVGRNTSCPTGMKSTRVKNTATS